MPKGDLHLHGASSQSGLLAQRDGSGSFVARKKTVVQQQTEIDARIEELKIKQEKEIAELYRARSSLVISVSQIEKELANELIFAINNPHEMLETRHCFSKEEDRIYHNRKTVSKEDNDNLKTLLRHYSVWISARKDVEEVIDLAKDLDYDIARETKVLEHGIVKTTWSCEKDYPRSWLPPFAKRGKTEIEFFVYSLERDGKNIIHEETMAKVMLYNQKASNAFWLCNEALKIQYKDGYVALIKKYLSLFEDVYKYTALSTENFEALKELYFCVFGKPFPVQEFIPDIERDFPFNPSYKPDAPEIPSGLCVATSSNNDLNGLGDDGLRSSALLNGTGSSDTECGGDMTPKSNLYPLVYSPRENQALLQGVNVDTEFHDDVHE